MLCNQTNKSLPGLQADSANRFGFETLGCHKNVAVDIGVEQINRAHMSVERTAHSRNDDIQRRL
jgi:hypothetical protein